MNDKMRYLTKLEEAALVQMGSLIANTELREQFFIDMAGAMVDEQPPEAARLIFHIGGLLRGPYAARTRFAVTTTIPSRERSRMLTAYVSRFTCTR